MIDNLISMGFISLLEQTFFSRELFAPFFFVYYFFYIFLGSSLLGSGRGGRGNWYVFHILVKLNRNKNI